MTKTEICEALARENEALLHDSQEAKPRSTDP